MTKSPTRPHRGPRPTTLLAIGLCLLGTPQLGSARQSTVTGKLTVDGRDYPLEHAAYEEGVGDMWLVASTAEADSMTVYELSGQGGAGLFLALDPATGKANGRLPSRLLHSAFPENFGAVLDPEAVQLDMEVLDGGRAVGRIWLERGEEDGHTYSFDITVDASYVEVDPCTDLGPVTVDGETGGPADAFEAFYAAIASCDWDSLKETLSGDMLSEWQKLEGDERSLDLFVEFFVREMPREASVVEVRMDGKKRATLVVRFGPEGGQTTDMVVERVGRNDWRIVETELIQL